MVSLTKRYPPPSNVRVSPSGVNHTCSMRIPGIESGGAATGSLVLLCWRLPVVRSGDLHWLESCGRLPLRRFVLLTGLDHLRFSVATPGLPEKPPLRRTPGRSKNHAWHTIPGQNLSGPIHRGNRFHFSRLLLVTLLCTKAWAAVHKKKKRKINIFRCLDEPASRVLPGLRFGRKTGISNPGEGALIPHSPAPGPLDSMPRSML